MPWRFAIGRRRLRSRSATTLGPPWRSVVARLSSPWLWWSLRVPFVFVYVVGLASEVTSLWRLDPSTTTLFAAAFTGFGLLGTLAFGLVRALPPDAAEQAASALAAGRRAFHAALLSLAAVLIVHGWSEGWPGMQLLGAYRATEVLVRALFVALGVGAASSGLVAIWRLDALLTRPSPGRA